MKMKTYLLPLLGIFLLAITTCSVEEPCPNEDKIQERPFSPYDKACLPYKGNETLVFYDSARQDTFTLYGEGYIIDWDTVKTVGLDNDCRSTYKLEHTWLWFKGSDERQILIDMKYEPFQRRPSSLYINLQNNFAKISASTNVDNKRLSKAYTIDSIYVQGKLYTNAFKVSHFGEGNSIGKFIMSAENEFIKIDGIGHTWELVEKK
jgi:hypothetical protein